MVLSRFLLREAMPMLHKKVYLVPSSRLFCDKKVEAKTEAPKAIHKPPEEGYDPVTGKRYRQGIEIGVCSDENMVYYPPGDIEVKTVPAKDINEVLNQPSLPDLFHIWFGKEMPTINDDKHPDRDLVNFPRPKIPLEEGPTKFMLIPEEWFNFFYKKTGVTGGYVFFGSLLTFLLSKELLIYEHEMFTGTCIIIIILAIRYKYGDKIAKYMWSIPVTQEQAWIDWQENMKKTLKEYIADQKKFLEFQSDSLIIFDAKKENIQLQREAEYRRRQMEVHDEVKRKLNYQLAIQEAKAQFSQRHMVKWIIDKVYQSITPDLQKKSLDDAISQLKDLSSKRAGVI